MDSGFIVGVFLVGMAAGALLESGVRIHLRDRIQRRFVEKLRVKMQSVQPVEMEANPLNGSVSRTEERLQEACSEARDHR